jgi:hypothetical protein
MHDINTIDKFIELRAKNITLEKIAEELKVSTRTLINWNKKYYKDILFQRQMEIDLIKEKYKISDSHNLEFYSQVIEKCKEIFLDISYKGMMRIDLVRIFNMAMNKVHKCNIITSKNINKFFQTEEEYLDCDSESKHDS